MPNDQFQLVTNVNMSGAFYVAKYGVKLMIDSGNGRIINMASIAASGARVGARDGLTAYKMSKHAIVGLTETRVCQVQHSRQCGGAGPSWNRNGDELVSHDE